MSPLIQLVYNSAATVEFTDADLEQLLTAARNKNASLGITGMLLYIDGCFFQTLEGPQDAVDKLAEQIRADRRHARMTTIIREPIAHRSFSEWTMGFTRLSAADARNLDGLNDFFDTGKVLTDVDAGRAKKLLLAFKQGRWRVKLAQTRAQPATEPAPQPATPAARLPEQPRPAFTFAFQPIVDAQGATHGYEALVRGEAGEPAEHVLQRVALGEIAAFEADAHRQALALARRLGVRSNLHLNVMLQAQLADRQLIEATLKTAALCDIEPSRLVLEIKHEAALSDLAGVASWLGHCRQRGLRISIDDFGSGYGGLGLLDRFQPDMISLSMWLVRGIESHGPRQAIVRGLVQTCGDLGIDIVAKGVETDEELAWLRDEGITLFQGHLLARPGFQSLPVAKLPAAAD